jgi:uncharacterized membrane protein
MSRRIPYLIALFILISISLNFAQSFSWQANPISQCDNPGESVVVHTYITNKSGTELSLRIIRTDYQLPTDWSSSFYVGGLSGIRYTSSMDMIPDPLTLSAFE